MTITRVPNFNPRSPWGERPFHTSKLLSFFQFQSTLPVGGATRAARLRKSFTGISIHAPRGGSDRTIRSATTTTGNFNPRSPWGERQLLKMIPNKAIGFQSTLPVGGATRLCVQRCRYCSISIHAPRGGSDTPSCYSAPAILYFNPRSPWGERPDVHADVMKSFAISIHAPRGGSDSPDGSQRSGGKISIHAPRGGSDFAALWQAANPQPFQSTLPVGGATSWAIRKDSPTGISIHAPRGGSDHLYRSQSI